MRGVSLWVAAKSLVCVVGARRARDQPRF